MNNAYELMEQLRANGAARFASTSLAEDHRPLTRKVGRQRAVRKTGVSLVSVGAAGAVAFAALHALPTHTQTPAATPNPSATASGTIEPRGTVYVAYGERVEYVAADLAKLFYVSQEEALAAIVAALPAEANGNPEGWVAPGEYHYDADYVLGDAAAWMVNMQIGVLSSTGQPQERWSDIIILASILDKEAPVLTDKGSVATVLTNRLEQGMPLQIESPLAYFLRADEKPVGDDGWAVDTPYNTYMYEGLPPSAIGAASREAIAAAADPAPGDWLFFLRKPDGNVLLFSTYAEFAVAVDEYFPGTGASES